MKVDFFIVGAPKSGTTSLYHYLASHPDVFMSSKKEPNYFSKSEIKQQGLYYPIDEVDSFSDYKMLFSSSKEGQILGESSVSYLFYPKVASKLHKHNSRAKIIMLLRDPIERAFSHYLMDFRLGFVNESFESIIKKNIKHNNLDLYYQQYIELSMYFEQVKRYFDVFKKENILVINSNEFRKDTLQVMQEVYSFLDVDTSFQLEINTKYNKYIQANNKLLQKMYSFRFLRNSLKKILPTILIARIKRIFFKKKDNPTLQSKNREFLHEIFANDINQLECLLSKDFASWKK